MREIGCAITAWVLLHWMRFSLIVLGFERTMRRATARRAPARQPFSTGSDVELVQRVARSIERAKRWQLRLTADDCLPVALVGVSMLRRLGAQADLALGMTRYPFAAHAWVVVGGLAIDFPRDKYSRFYGVNMGTGAQYVPGCPAGGLGGLQSPP